MPAVHLLNSNKYEIWVSMVAVGEAFSRLVVKRDARTFEHLSSRFYELAREERIRFCAYNPGSNDCSLSMASELMDFDERLDATDALIISNAAIDHEAECLFSTDTKFVGNITLHNHIYEVHRSEIELKEIDFYIDE